MSVFAIYESSLLVGDSFADKEEVRWYEENQKENVVLFSQIKAMDSVEAVRDAFNKYFSKPKTIDSYRECRFSIKEHEMQSQKLYAQGGGCGVYRQFFIKKIDVVQKATQS